MAKTSALDYGAPIAEMYNTQQEMAISAPNNELAATNMTEQEVATSAPYNNIHPAIIPVFILILASIYMLIYKQGQYNHASGAA